MFLIILQTDSYTTDLRRLKLYTLLITVAFIVIMIMHQSFNFEWDFFLNNSLNHYIEVDKYHGFI